MKRKSWMRKKYTKWTGGDMLKAVLTMTGIGTLICSVPIVGLMIKEWID